MGGVFELIARAAIVAAVAGSFGYVGVCLADPAAWLAALVPIVPYYFYKISRISRKETHGGRITAEDVYKRQGQKCLGRLPEISGSLGR